MEQQQKGGLPKEVMCGTTFPGVETYDVDQLYNLFTEKIRSGAEKNSMYREPRNADERRNPWFDKECSNFKKQVRTAWRDWTKSKDILENQDKLKCKFSELKSKYTSLIKCKKVNKDAIRIEILKRAKTDRAFWNAIFFKKKKNSVGNKISIER